MAIMSLLQAMQDKDDEAFSNVSRLSENTVRFYVELMLAEELDEQDESEVLVDDINQHPLMQWEVATQNELFDFIKNAAENKNSCIKAKGLVLEEGLSNLGIEI